jgi:hypothetical protein
MANIPDEPRPGDPNDPHRPAGHPPEGAAGQGHDTPPAAAADDDVIDLGNPGQGVDLSGVSVIEWASLTEGQPSGNTPPARFDAPSDAEMIAAAGPAAPRDDSAVDLSADAYVVEEDALVLPGDADNSAIDLTPEGFVMQDGSSVYDVPGPGAPPAPAAAADDSAIDLTQGIDIVAENVVETSPPVVPAGGSAVDLAGGDAGIDLPVVGHPAAGPEESAIDLTDVGIDVVAENVIEALPPGAGSSSDVLMAPPEGVDAVVQAQWSGELPDPAESGVALTPADVIIDETTTSSGTALVGSDSSVDLLSEQVAFDDAGPASGSVRDLIAEGLESGVGLRPGKKAGDESSVDLGSSAHTLDAFEEEQHPVPPPAMDTNIAVDDFVAAGRPAPTIDLERTKPAASLPGVAESGIALTMQHVVGEDDDVVIEEGVDEAPPDVAPVKRGGPADEAHEPEEEEAPAAKKKPEPAARPRGRTGAWLGGALLGGVAAAAACVGVWVFGVEPPQSLRDMAGVAPAKPSGPSGVPAGPGNGPPRPAAPAFDAALGQIRNGDLDQVQEADLARADQAKPEHLVALAEYAWLKYLRDERGKNAKAPLKADAAPVTKALGYLEKAVAAKNADALFLRGQIHEMTGQAGKAKQDYEQGVQQFKDNAEEKARFETALLVLELTPKVARLAPAGVAPRLLAVLLVGLQPPPAPGGPPAAQGESAQLFFQSLKLARQDQLAKAIEVLKEAGKLHDLRRYQRPRKPQNPRSDPLERTFLLAAEQIEAYWALLEQLKAPQYLAAKPADRPAVIQAVVKKAEDAAAATVLKELAAKLVKDKPVAGPDDLVKLVNDERKANAALLKETTDKLITATKELDTTKATLATTAKELTTSQDMLKASAAREKELQAANAASAGALKAVAGALGVPFKDPKASAGEVVREAQETKRIARIVDPKGTIVRLERELAADRATLKLRWTPGQMLTFWRPVLQEGRSQGGFGANAERDAGLVLADPSASAVQKGRALAVRGLVLRNEEKYAEAEPVLQKAVAALAPTKLAGRSAWLEAAESALAEVKDPAAALASRANGLVAQNRIPEALSVLEKGIKAAPGAKGSLYAQRALIALEAARARGAAPGDPLLRSAGEDAAAAAKDGLAEGHYAAGRVAEERGRLDEAVKEYRSAVAALKAGDASAARYKVALARALLKSRGEEAPGVRPAPPPVRTGRAPAGKAGRTLAAADFVGLMLALTLQAPDLPLEGPRVREAERLADEVLALGDKAPFDARAQALAVKGLYTRALLTYTAGLRENKLLAPGYANALVELIRTHPVLKRPESLAVPDPVAGEKHYAAGLNFYAARRYADAEKELLAAVENDNGDARYYYFLGLARLAQGKRDGYEDFDQGARLERLGRPDRGTVSAALERVQGPVRRALNDVRSRPARDRAR